MTKKTTLNELGEMLEFVVKRMATKDDIRSIVRGEIVPFRLELKGDIAALEDRSRTSSATCERFARPQ